MTTRTRPQLKSYFVKNAIPSEGNFADLIDSPLNQSEDGVYKQPDEPLAIVATGPQKRVLRLHPDAGPTPDWLIALNPAQDPGTPASARPGLGITSAAGLPRLFLDLTTGHLGLGTNNPGANRLQVEGNTRINGTLTVSGLLSAEGGLSVKGDAVVNGSLTVNGPFTASGAAGLSFSGDTSVNGVLTANGLRSPNSLVLNDYTAPVAPASNVLLLSPPKDRDGWIYRDVTDTNGNSGIYHRQLDTAVKGLPANSLGFIGGSALKAYVDMVNGAGFFAGNLGVGASDTAGNRLLVQGNARVNGNVDSTGTASATEGFRTSNFAIGNAAFGKLDYPYESVQLPSNRNFRLFFGETERFTVGNNGAVAINGNLGVAAITASGPVTANAGLKVGGATTVATLTASALVTASNGLKVAGNTDVAALTATKLNVNGPTDLDDLLASGPVTANAGLKVTGNTTLGGALNVTALATAAGLAVVGHTTVTTLDSSVLITANGGLKVNGVSTVASVTASGLLTANGGLTVTGYPTSVTSLTASGPISANGGLTVNGTLTLTGLTVNGPTTLGALTLNDPVIAPGGVRAGELWIGQRDGSMPAAAYMIRTPKAQVLRLWVGDYERFTISETSVLINFSDGYWEFKPNGELLKFNLATRKFTTMFPAGW